MADQFRSMTVGPDPGGKTWQVEFGWQQNGTAIRHADTVDVKFFLHNGNERTEKVIALPNPALLELSRSLGRPITDPWCSRLAAHHLEYMISTGEDMEKSLVTVTAEQMEHYAGSQTPAPAR